MGKWGVVLKMEMIISLVGGRVRWLGLGVSHSLFFRYFGVGECPLSSFIIIIQVILFLVLTEPMTDKSTPSQALGMGTELGDWIN